MMEKTLPHNIEAEAGVLGSLIINPAAIAQVSDFLVADDFYRDAHRCIYRAVTHLFERHESADFITLCDELERAGRLDDAGGASYITGLINETPTSSNIEYYARIVERTAVRRRLIHAAAQIAANAYEETDADKAVSRAEELIYQIGARKSGRECLPLAEIARDYLDDLDFLHEHRSSLIGVPTGFSVLDHLLGGLQKTDLITLAARPSMGKSSLMLNFAHHAACTGHPVAIFSLEMGKRQLMGRLLSARMGIGLSVLRTGRWGDDGWDKIMEGMGSLSELPIYIDDTGALSPSQLRSKVRRLQSERGIELVIVDYIGLMEVAVNGHAYENKVQEVSKITRELKALALECNLPVLALSQLSREVERRADKRPQLADLRDSGSIEQDSDVVMFIYRDDVYKDARTPPDNKAEIIVAKHRNGPVGDVELYFEPRHVQFLGQVRCA